MFMVISCKKSYIGITMSEFQITSPIPEQLTHDTYNELLTSVRELHFNAKTGEHYGRFAVESHTDHRTFMRAEGPKDLTISGAQLILEDSLQGVLIRSIQTHRITEDERSLKEKAFLLNGFNEQPKWLSVSNTAYGMYDSDRLIRRIQVEGMPLDEEYAKGLTDDIHELQSEHHLARLSKVASLLQRLTVKRW